MRLIDRAVAHAHFQFFSNARLSTTNGLEGKMHNDPDRDGKTNHRKQSIPSPREVVGLYRENRDHEVVSEPGMSKKRAIFWVAFTNSADEGHSAYD